MSAQNRCYWSFWLKFDYKFCLWNNEKKDQGVVVQSTVSVTKSIVNITKSLVNNLLTLLVDIKLKVLIAFAENKNVRNHCTAKAPCIVFLLEKKWKWFCIQYVRYYESRNNKVIHFERLVPVYKIWQILGSGYIKFCLLDYG